MAQTATVGKKELAAALGWSRPTLDKRLKTDPRFPVVSKGDQSGGWQFDRAKVEAYLAGKPAAVDLAQLRDVVKPPEPTLPVRAARRSADHEGEATARQRKDAADASLKEDKLARERAQLVEAEHVRQVLTTMLARLGKNLDALPEQAARLLNAPDTSVDLLRTLIDDVRTAMVKDVDALLADA